jgi:hypothetical protein
LLPALIAALAAATLPLWSGRYFWGLWMPCFGLAICFLALAPFGQEMSWGTFGLLLSQPEERRRFWRIKTELLALALLSAWGLFILSWRIGGHNLDPNSSIGLGPYDDVVLVSGLLALLAFSSGLWTTLLLRDVTTAFFATLIAPTALCAATVLALSQFHNILIGPPFLAVMAAYSVAGYLVARRLFLGAEDVALAWTGGQISLPKIRGLPLRWLAFGFQKKRGPWSALIVKELQLQEATMVVVALLALLHLAALAARHFAPRWLGEGGLAGDAVRLIWMMVPWVVGCVAVSEERRYNTLESQHCLPVRQRHQFAVKLTVVLALGTVMGGVLPWLLEHLNGYSKWTGLESLGGLVLAAAVVAAIAFFASTMSRGILEAFAVALLFSFLLWVMLALLMEEVLYHNGSEFDPRAVSFFQFLVWPAMFAACIRLAYRNYRSLPTGWRLWAVNLAWPAGVMAAVMFVSCVSSRLLRMYFGI